MFWLNEVLLPGGGGGPAAQGKDDGNAKPDNRKNR